jgi:hypothetical protein
MKEKDLTLKQARDILAPIPDEQWATDTWGRDGEPACAIGLLARHEGISPTWAFPKLREQVENYGGCTIQAANDISWRYMEKYTPLHTPKARVLQVLDKAIERRKNPINRFLTIFK